MLELEVSGAVARISPVDGGRLASLELDGFEVLVTEGDTAIAWGCYPMAPWAGRVRHGQFFFDGIDRELPLSHPPHAMHGTVYDRRWVLEDDGSLTIDLGESWPFGGLARQHFDLQPGRLTCTLEVQAGSQRMPAQLGWHPWFRRPVTLTFGANAMYVRDAEGMPTGELVEPPPGPWDDCFTDVTNPPQLVWEDGPTLLVSSSCDHWVIYDQSPLGVCVEPQSGPPDAFNLAPVVLEPGGSLTATMSFTWS